MATPPPFSRTATELQTLKHELQRLKVHLIAHLRSKGIPIVVPPPSSIITKENVTTDASDEKSADKIVGIERKKENNIEEDNEAETEESSEKLSLLASDRTVSNVMSVELLPSSLQLTSSSSFSINSKSSTTSDQSDLAGNNNGITTSSDTLLSQHQQCDRNPSVHQQDSVHQRCCTCCAQFMQYFSPCSININFCKRTRWHTNDSSNNNDDEVVLSSPNLRHSWITTCYNYMFRSNNR